MKVSDLLCKRAELPGWLARKAGKNEYEKQVNDKGPAVANSKPRQYLQSVLDEQCERLRKLPDAKGNRNSSLNSAVFQVARLVHLSDLSKPSILEQFRAATAHWQSDFPPRRFESTFESAWKGGIEKPFAPDLIQYGQSKLSIITGTELRNKVIPPARWIIPGLLTDGLALLGGKPKAGKSWLALQIAIAIANGGTVLGKPVSKGKALYAALEDSERRLQGRLDVLLGSERQLDNLFITRSISRLDKGGVDELLNFAEANSDVQTMIIDTFARVKPPSKPGGNSYDHDSGVLAPLQQLAMEKGIAIILITHLRKQSNGDIFDQISGTLGLNGIADSIWVLTRASNQETGKLHLTGRDVEEQELAVRFDRETCQWSSLGPAGLHFTTEERRRIYQFLHIHGRPAGPNEVYQGIGGSLNSIKHLLPKMANDGFLVKESRGKYAIPESQEGLIMPEP